MADDKTRTEMATKQCYDAWQTSCDVVSCGLWIRNAKHFNKNGLQTALQTKDKNKNNRKRSLWKISISCDCSQQQSTKIKNKKKIIG